MSQKLLQSIRTDLLKRVDKVYKEGSTNFFNEAINPLGVRTGIVRKLAKQTYKELKHLSKDECFDLCEKLMQKGTMEETTIALQWSRERYDELTESDFARFETWIKKYITNWAHTDDLCTHTLGWLLLKYPSLVQKTKPWRKSKNRWFRRSSAVALIPLVWDKKALKETFQTCDTLLTDPDDLVQKGYGWLLKEASIAFPGEVFDFVLKRKDGMPRTALRYAIERYPKEMRKQAMAK